jgi:hypothetical protein
MELAAQAAKSTFLMVAGLAAAAPELELVIYAYLPSRPFLWAKSPWALASNDLEKYLLKPSDKEPLSLKLSSYPFYITLPTG